MAALHKLRQQYLLLERSEARNQRGRQKALWSAALQIIASLEAVNEASQTKQSLSTIRVQLEEAMEIIDGWVADL